MTWRTSLMAVGFAAAASILVAQEKPPNPPDPPNPPPQMEQTPVPVPPPESTTTETQTQTQTTTTEVQQPPPEAPPASTQTVTTTSRRTAISGTVSAYQPGQSITIVLPSKKTTTYTITETSQLPQDLVVGKRVTIQTTVVSGKPVVKTVTYRTTTKTTHTKAVSPQ